jgi:uncharacterized membrane protein
MTDRTSLDSSSADGEGSSESLGGPERVREHDTLYRHPVNQIAYERAPLGARVADRVTGFMGSWTFLVFQTVLVALWLGANLALLTRPFDPYPFILLNLAFSTQAAYAAPLILLAGNRASHRDRLTLEHAAAESDLADAQNERILNGNTEILEHVAALEARILSMEQTILVAVGAAPPPDEER